MQYRFLICAVSAVLALTPALADTSTSTMNVNPTNALTVTPITNQSATTTNNATQINNQNSGVSSFGGGIACQSPQIALGGYGARQTSGAGLAGSDTGVSIEYVAPVGGDGNKTCSALAREALKARQLDNSFTMIAKCVDFARSGVQLDTAVYPELAHACAGVHVALTNAGNPPPSPVGTKDTSPTLAAKTTTTIAIHLSDFSPEHNSELQRIAMHRLQRLASLEAKGIHSGNNRQRRIVAERIRHENVHLRAVIAEYDLENAFLRRLLKDQTWHAHNGLRERILSYNDQATTVKQNP